MIVARSALYREAGYWNGTHTRLLVALAFLLTIEIYWFPWGWQLRTRRWLLLDGGGLYGLRRNGSAGFGRVVRSSRRGSA